MVPTQSGIALETLEFSEESGAYTATYDQEATAPSMAVISAVADALDADPLELDPLFDTLDTDALDNLLREDGGSPIHVSFAFAGCEITMSGDGRIRLAVNDEAPDESQ